MTKVHRSPLTDDDLNMVEALAKKSNAHGRREGYAPLYVALDVGGADQPDGYLLLCWPATNHKAAVAARLIFDHVAEVAHDVYGAQMVVTEVAEAPDASAR